jgi:peptidoglycan/xylan/chitin deacetylase (PgdA/CDA1 family)
LVNRANLFCLGFRGRNKKANCGSEIMRITFSVLILFLVSPVLARGQIQYLFGGMVRGDLVEKKIALVFTGHEFAEGGEEILKTLDQHRAKAAFFFTGDFYRDPDFEKLIFQIKAKGHYLGAHSDKHLLYCDWGKRDSLLVAKVEFLEDLERNYDEMRRFGVSKVNAPFFLPPYEWHNDSISAWTLEAGLHLINFSSGTRSHADYTDPSMPNYVDSQKILQSILDYENSQPQGLNGFILLMHIGVGPKRVDKFHTQIPVLLQTLRSRGYEFVSLSELFPIEVREPSK